MDSPRGCRTRDFADLIAYLEGLRSAGQGTPGSGVTGPIILPPGFSSDRVASGITGATAMTVAPDGRIFVCEQTGALRVVKGGTLLPQPVRVRRGRQPLGARAHRRHARPSLRGKRLRLRLLRDPAALRPSPDQPLHGPRRRRRARQRGRALRRRRPDQARRLRSPPGHQGGAIHFGKDGKLYVALGDQTAGAPAQAMTTLQGKLLRLNPDGSIPEDNPFYRKAQRQVPGDLGPRAAQPVHLRRAARHRPDLDQRRGQRHLGRNQRRTRRRQLRLADLPKARRPTRGSAARSTTTRSPRSPAARSARSARGCASHLTIKGSISSWISSGAGSRSSTPIIRQQVETFAAGLTRPVDLAFSPDGALYVLLRDAWVVDGNFRPGTGSLLRIRPQTGVTEPTLAIAWSVSRR